MAQLVLGGFGAGVGAAVGGLTGAQWGFSAGVLLAGVLFPPRQGVQNRGMLADLNVSGSAYGSIIPMVYGDFRLPGNIIWAPALTQHVTHHGGKKFSGQPSVNNYTYTFTGQIALCEGPVGQVRRVWCDDILVHNPTGYGGAGQVNLPITGISQANGATVTCPGHGYQNGQAVQISGVVGMTQINGLIGHISSHTTNTFILYDINSSSFSAYSSGGVATNLSQAGTIPQPDWMTIFLGDEAQQPWSVAQAILGAGNVPAYRGLCYLGFNNYDLTPHGGRIPTVSAEVANL